MKTTVLGLGNVLMGDDAFGPWVVQLILAGWKLPASVNVIDAGTPGLDLVPHLEGTDALIVVDTVRASAPPGSLRVYSKDELLRRPPPARVSPHDPGLKDTLLTLRLHGDEPQHVSLVGVVPENTGTGIGMTEALMNAVPYALALVIRELDRLGFSAQPRTTPARLDVWWQQPASPAAAAAHA